MVAQSTRAVATTPSPNDMAIAGFLQWNAGQVRMILNSVARDASPAELAYFLTFADRLSLDPLSRQIYYVKRKPNEAGTIQVGIDGYRLIADRTGKYAGNEDYEFGPEVTINGVTGPEWAKATVWKLVDGQRCPFTASAYLAEYAQSYMYRSRPRGMLGKSAEALALRKAFPNELSGVYTREEMPEEPESPTTYRVIDRETGEVSAPPRPAAPPPAPRPPAPVEDKRIDMLPADRQKKFTEIWTDLYQQALDLGLAPQALKVSITESEGTKRIRALEAEIAAARLEQLGEGPNDPQG